MSSSDYGPVTRVNFTNETHEGPSRAQPSGSGVVRVTFGPEGFETQEAINAHSLPDPNRVVGGTIRHTYGGANDGQTQSSESVTRATISPANGTAGGSVLASFRQEGPHQTVETIPGVPASRTLVAVAIRDGLLRRNGSGQLEDVSGQQEVVQRSQAPQPQQAAQYDGSDIFDAQGTALLAETIKDTPQWAYDGAMARLVAWMAHGTGSEEAVAERFAKDVGGDPAEALERVRGFRRLHEGALETALTPLGLTGDRGNEFLETLRANPSRYQDCLQQLLHERSAKGFIKEAAAWVRHNPSPEAKQFKAAGWDVGYDPTTGEMLIKAPGRSQWVTMKQVAEA